MYEVGALILRKDEVRLACASGKKVQDEAKAKSRHPPSPHLSARREVHQAPVRLESQKYLCSHENSAFTEKRYC